MSGIQTLFDTGQDNLVQSAYDAGIYELISDDAVIDGVGDEYEMHTTAGSLSVTFNAGSQSIIGGAFHRILTTQTVTLPANSTVNVCATIDLTNPNGATGSITCKSDNDLRKDNLATGSGIRDLVLYRVTTNGSGITGTPIDKRVIKGTRTSFGNYGILVMSQAEYDALPLQDKEENVIYMLYRS